MKRLPGGKCRRQCAPATLTNSETNRTRRTVGLSITVNGLLSWTLWPLVLPPFRLYSGRELLEVLLWQGMGLVGWPVGLVGGLANLLRHRAGTDRVSLLLAMYPVIILLLLFSLIPKHPQWWVLAVLHLLTGTFAAVWYKVLNGYDFMRG
jgi:hypothetical protein